MPVTYLRPGPLDAPSALHGIAVEAFAWALVCFFLSRGQCWRLNYVQHRVLSHCIPSRIQMHDHCGPPVHRCVHPMHSGTPSSCTTNMLHCTGCTMMRTRSIWKNVWLEPGFGLTQHGCNRQIKCCPPWHKWLKTCLSKPVQRFFGVTPELRYQLLHADPCWPHWWGPWGVAAGRSKSLSVVF